MAKKKLIGAFIGVPDEMLYDIGRVVVLGAQLDYRRMLLLEAVKQVPAATSARFSRKDLTKQIAAAFGNPPFDRLQNDVARWLHEVSNLLGIRDELAHSVGGYETRGDGKARYVKLHPKQPKPELQFTPPKLSEFVSLMLDANGAGVELEIQAQILRERGSEGHKAWLQQREQYKLAVQQLDEIDLYTEQEPTSPQRER